MAIAVKRWKGIDTESVSSAKALPDEHFIAPYGSDITRGLHDCGVPLKEVSEGYGYYTKMESSRGIKAAPMSFPNQVLVDTWASTLRGSNKLLL